MSHDPLVVRDPHRGDAAGVKELDEPTELPDFLGIKLLRLRVEEHVLHAEDHALELSHHSFPPSVRTASTNDTLSSGSANTCAPIFRAT